jgi:hypothetical protein
MTAMSPADRDVLTSLPRSRSTRRSAKRAGAPADGPAAPKPEQPTAPEAAAANPKPKAPAKAAATTKAKRPAAKARPKPKAAAAPSSPPPPPAGWAAPRTDDRDTGGPGELLGTAVQAVGELAQIGLAYGGQALKQALSRLPKP